MDKLTAMTTFVTVVETGSFTRAADILSVPKARVSQRISDLEHHLRIRLLNRTTRTLSLTDDGRAYFERCLIILREIDNLEETLKEGMMAPRGRLRVEALVSVARWVIAPRLHEFHQRYPHIAVNLGGSDRISHLLDEGIDCAIRGGALEDSSYIARHVCDVEMGLYAAPGYLKNVDSIEHPSQLLHHSLLSPAGNQRNKAAPWQLTHQQTVFELPTEYRFQFDDPDVAIASCIAGSGICPGAPFAVEYWVRHGALVPVLPAWSFKARPIHIIYPSNKHLSARVRCFVDWTLELMQASPSLGMTPWQLAESVPMSQE